MTIRQATDRDDFMRCWPLMQALHPGLDAEDYLVRVLHMMDEGYRLIFIEVEETVTALCGYRYHTGLQQGRSLQLDDLFTAPNFRGQGHATALIEQVASEARAAGCTSLQTQAAAYRHAAHRLLVKGGFLLAGHHFVLRLEV